MNPTRWLLAAVLALAVADVGIRVRRVAAEAPVLPRLAGFDPAQVTEVRLGRVDEPLVLARADGRWTITAPVEAEADPIEVDALLGQLAGGVHPDLALPPDPEGYGLSGGQEIRVDVTGAGGELLSLVIGADAGAGGTFVRLPGDDTVYRAPIGGRSLYDRPARTLLDRRIASCAPEQIGRVDLPNGTVARRTGEGWAGDRGPVDGPTVEQLVRKLCALRGAEVAAADRVQEWFATVTLHTDGDPIAIRFGRTGDLRYAARAERVWRVAGEWVDRLAEPATFADRALWTARDLRRITLSGGGRDGELARTGEEWVVRRPANVDVDPARAQALAAWLERPRVVAWATAAEAAAFRGEQTLIIEASSGSERLEIGATDAGGTLVRARGRTGRVDPAIARGIAAIFGW